MSQRPNPAIAVDFEQVRRYRAGNNGRHPRLPELRDTDELGLALAKLKVLAHVLCSGEVTVSTDNVRKVSLRYNSNPTVHVNSQQRLQWRAWLKNYLPPKLDWNSSKAPVPEADQPAEHLQLELRARAMAIIWRQPGATAENAAWLCENRLDLQPLVNAAVSFMKISRPSDNAGRARTASAEAEKAIIDQTLRAARARIPGLYREIFQSMVRLSRFEYALAVIQARANALDGRPAAATKRKAPMPDEESSAWPPPLDNWSDDLAVRTRGGPRPADKRRKGDERQPRQSMETTSAGPGNGHASGRDGEGLRWEFAWHSIEQELLRTGGW